MLKFSIKLNSSRLARADVKKSPPSHWLLQDKKQGEKRELSYSTRAKFWRDVYLEGHEEGDGLNGVVSSVDVVAHEEVIRVWRFAANPGVKKKLKS